jgi:aspartyl-tRNA(Asn)/glutamyl-tRNA(Gln) amidotransferase subunit C
MSLKIDQNLVKHIGELARIELKESELANYKKNFEEIVGYIGNLEEVNVEGVQPLFNPIAGLNINKIRKDEIQESLPVNKVLMNAPAKESAQFKVNAVIEEE